MYLAAADRVGVERALSGTHHVIPQVNYGTWAILGIGSTLCRPIPDRLTWVAILPIA